jgi:hypothetical protein
MGGIAPADACSPPAILTEWRFYTCPKVLDGSFFMVNLRSGERFWLPPDSDWDYEWNIEPIPNPKGTWYRVPSSRQWVQFDVITSWIHLPTGYHWYLVEDTARPISARPLLPRQIELILAKLTLSDDPYKKGRCCNAGQIGALLESHPSSPYVLCGCNIVNNRGGLPAVVTNSSVDNG